LWLKDLGTLFLESDHEMNARTPEEPSGAGSGEKRLVADVMGEPQIVPKSSDSDKGS
jgi:hypothetical protein